MPKFGEGIDPVAAGKRSAEVRRELADRKKGAKGLERLQMEAYELTPELVRAAKGEGHWKELSTKDRYQALKLVLEYGLGKPRPLERGEDTNGNETPEDDAFSILPGVEAAP